MKNNMDTLKPVNTHDKPLILAVETSSRIGSVAIAIGAEVLAETVFSCPLMHSAEIFPAIVSLLKCAGRKPDQIEHVYISGGPGSFTGLRIAATLAKGMHLANAVKVVTVDTLDIIAYNSADYFRENIDIGSDFGRNRVPIEKIATILDAKRGQFFIAVYNCHLNKGEDSQQLVFDKLYEKIMPDSLMSASDFIAQFAASDKPIWLLGDGLVYHRDKFKAEGVRFFLEKYWSPHANKVHRLGWQIAQQGGFADPIELRPFYLRQPEITIKSR